ncbi:hypothetical protein D3C87_1454800 [compost metagenome]
MILIRAIGKRTRLEINPSCKTIIPNGIIKVRILHLKEHRENARKTEQETR